jgi:phenylalanyl-tRNA synthetase alpha chain
MNKTSMDKAEIDKFISSLTPVEARVLPHIKNGIDLNELILESKLKDIEVMRALQWLQNKEVINLKESSKTVVALDKNGIEYQKTGLPERKFLNAISGKMPVSEIITKAAIASEELNICLGKLKRSAAIIIEKDQKTNELIISLTLPGEKQKGKESLEEIFLKKKFPLEFDKLSDEEKFAYNELIGRKNIIRKDDIKKIEISTTERFIDIQKHIKPGKPIEMIEKLTPTIIKSGEWQKKKFRRYDVSVNVPQIYGGRIHYVDQSVRYIKKIWLELGFTEMKGNIVQTAFWDLDSLFVPQDHPAREMQDTFYLKEPSKGTLPKELTEKIKKVHEDGADTGSAGWRYKWSSEKAMENLLRTHTTVLSAQTIAKLKESDLPAKFFSVGRVYRNEALSWKSLFEFVQVEGIVVDPDANFMNLKGYLKEFFAKMGFPDVRIRPAHFPYTEPSAEIDVWHPIKKGWVELGGSGIFRPEVTKTLLGKEIPVLAWGFGMERTIMQYYGISDIRDLYKNDLKQLREIKAWMR